MRITIDLDSQTGQPNISASSQSLVATARQGGSFSGGATTIPGSASGPGATNAFLQNGGAARYAGSASGTVASSIAAKDAGAAPTQTKD